MAPDTWRCCTPKNGGAPHTVSAEFLGKSLSNRPRCRGRLHSAGSNSRVAFVLHKPVREVQAHDWQKVKSAEDHLKRVESNLCN